LYDLCCQRIVDAFRRANTDTNMAGKLHHVFTAAGLPSPTMRMQAVIGGGESTSDWLSAIPDLTATLLPSMVRVGIVDADDFSENSIDTLGERIRAEVFANESVIVGPAEIGAWSQL
jgi:hypothetical protein